MYPWLMWNSLCARIKDLCIMPSREKKNMAEEIAPHFRALVTLFQGSCVQFPAFTWWLTTTHDALFRPAGIHVGITLHT